jgi:vesicle transport through interaction with t-SNAREs protein 1
MSHTYLPFERYEDEFKTLTKQVQDSLNDDEEVQQTGNLITQCDELLQQMALEARSVPDASLKRELLQTVRTAKSQLQTYKEKYEKQSLMSSANSKSSGGHRERLLQQQDQLRNQNSQLDNARKVLEETEQVALEIGSELGNNRETLESAHGRIHQVTGLTGRARRIVQSMNQRAVQQKLLLYGLSGSVIVVFCVLVWWMR